MIIDELDKELFDKLPDSTLNKAARVKAEELLDNLGYIDVDLSENARKRDQHVDDDELQAGIAQFRTEYSQYADVFNIDYELTIDALDNELTEDEIKLLSQMSSLEGEFDLHAYSFDYIRSVPILTRILNLRLCMLDVFGVKLSPKYDDNTIAYLKKIAKWCGTADPVLVLRLIGDIEDLSLRISNQSSFENSNYHHIVYFKNRLNTKEEFEARKDEDDRALFDSRLHSQSTSTFNTFEHTSKRKDRIRDAREDDLNAFMIRIVQLRLFLIGTYDGNLDGDLGPISLEGMQKLLSLVSESTDGVINYTDGDLVVFIKRGEWALNAKLLISNVLPALNDYDEENGFEQRTSMSAQIQELVVDLKEDEQSAVMKEVEVLINENAESAKRKRGPSQGGRKFFKSIRRFFKRAKDFIKQAINKVKEAIKHIKNLFKWIGNGIRLLLRELREVFKYIKAAVSHFVIKRSVVTSNKTGSITTNFDFGSDSVTFVKGEYKTLLVKHRKRIHALTTSIEKGANIVGLIIKTVIRFGKGPVGWLQIGIALVKIFI